ncbi:hypothetical protein CJ030_MR1G002328 [Morella rubra]|uniref:DUF674 domain-containing protein n=1 Tax=Morella rubra TaxID=262757 RepID=A0A6A1WK26_9ROSI|nr:hypothetical protein CJ030_MR1G002328 [Morella rubra]
MATTTPRSSKTLSLKLTIDNSSNKVFAEAGKEFVDFLFGLLQIPIGSIVGLLLDNGMVGSGSLGRVQESIKNLDPSYLQPNQSKDPLLRPKAAYTPLFLQNLASSNIETIPSIPDKKTIQSINPASSSPFGGPSVFQISKPIKTTSPFSSPSLNPVVSSVAQLEENGYVRGVVTYRVMDD